MYTKIRSPKSNGRDEWSSILKCIMWCNLLSATMYPPTFHALTRGRKHKLVESLYTTTCASCLWWEHETLEGTWWPIIDYTTWYTSTCSITHLCHWISPPRIAVELITTQVHSPAKCRWVTQSIISLHNLLFQQLTDQKLVCESQLETADNGACMHKEACPVPKAYVVD